MNDELELRAGAPVQANGYRISLTRIVSAGPEGRPERVLVSVTAPDGSNAESERGIGDSVATGREIWEIAGITGTDADAVVRLSYLGVELRPGVVVLSPERQAEARERNAVSPEQWAQARERVRKAEDERARRLFGDRAPFAIPDQDADA